MWLEGENDKKTRGPKEEGRNKRNEVKKDERKKGTISNAPTMGSALRWATLAMRLKGTDALISTQLGHGPYLRTYDAKGGMGSDVGDSENKRGIDRKFPWSSIMQITKQKDDGATNKGTETNGDIPITGNDSITHKQDREPDADKPGVRRGRIIVLRAYIRKNKKGKQLQGTPQGEMGAVNV